VWEVAGLKELKTLKAPDAVTSVVFGPDNATLYSVGFDNLVHVWNTGTGMETKKFGPTQDNLYGVVFSRDGKQLATVTYGATVTTWNLADGKPAFTKKLKTVAYTVAFTPDGKALVTGHGGVGGGNGFCQITPIAP